MRTYVLGLLVAGGLWLAWRHLTGRGRHALSLGLVVVVLLPTGWYEARWRAAEHRYSRVAEQLLTTPRPVAVRCERLSASMVNVWQWEGWVAYPADGSPPPVAVLTYETCGALGEWVRGGGRSRKRAHVDALHVFVHEVMHLDLVTDEAEADCLAMQHTPRAAELFGSTPEQGRAMAEAYWRGVYPDMPDGYRSAECRPDGALDRSPGDGLWP